MSTERNKGNRWASLPARSTSTHTDLKKLLKVNTSSKDLGWHTFCHEESKLWRQKVTRLIFLNLFQDSEKSLHPVQFSHHREWVGWSLSKAVSFMKLPLLETAAGFNGG